MDMDTQPNSRPPVGSLAEYIKQITEITHETQNDPSQALFYRGHADSRWKLKPTAYRIYPDGKSHRDVELQMYQEMLRRNPQAFQDCNTTFERLVKMQHYGLPTRLLDLTQNPLVALYFACCEKSKCDGEVSILKVNKKDIYFQENIPSNILAEFNFRFSQSNLLLDILKKYLDNLHELGKNIENFNIQDADLVLKTKRNIMKLEVACIKTFSNSVLKKDFNLYKRLMRLTDIFIISLRKFTKISLDSNNLEFSSKMWNIDEEIFEFIAKKIQYRCYK